MSANLENPAVATILEKVSFHSNPKEMQCQKCSNYHTVALISHSSKVILKIFQARLQQYMNCELPVQTGFRKGRETRDQFANTHGIIEKAREFQKKPSTSVPLTMLKPLYGSQPPVENSSRDGNTRPPHLPPEKSVYRSGRNSENWTWNNRLVLSWERNISRLYIVTLLI